MPLGLATVGKEVIIKRTNVDDRVKRHLENLGILQGEKVTPVSQSAGDIVLRVRDSRIAINKGLAMKIIVE